MANIKLKAGLNYLPPIGGNPEQVCVLVQTACHFDKAVFDRMSKKQLVDEVMKMARKDLMGDIQAETDERLKKGK